MENNFELFFEKNNKTIEAYKKMPLQNVIFKISDSKTDDKEQILLQIVSLNKVSTKLPTWCNTPKILFPPSIHLEQSSSEIAADFKSKIVSNQLLIDLTGGYGVDAYFFSKRNKDVIYIEKYEKLFDISSWNFIQLKSNNITSINIDCDTFLNTFKSNVDAKEIMVYIDPARRDLNNNKMVSLQETEPNIVTLLPKIFKIATKVLIKTSPMLDIDTAIRELNNITLIYIVSIKNECKELLFLVEKDANVEPKILAINIENDTISEFSFYKNDEVAAIPNYSIPLIYLYEPSASMLKSGAFKLIATKNNLFKIAPNTHLYTSENINIDFQGKIFEIVADISLKQIKKYIIDNKINVITRNYPMTSQEVKSKYNLIDGGNYYLICFKNQKNITQTLFCKRLK